MRSIITVFIAFVLFILLFPLMLIIYFLIFFSDFKNLDFRNPDFKNPIFTQKRIGYRLKTFKIIKFRTMLKGSEKISPHTVKNDHRITKIGKILRKYKLDELPQLINILKRDMNFVGPRPWLDIKTFQGVEKIKDIDKLWTKRHSVKPGLTGLAQINFVLGEHIVNRINRDMKYIDERSLKLDIKIFIATIIKICCF